MGNVRPWSVLLPLVCHHCFCTFQVEHFFINIGRYVIRQPKEPSNNAQGPWNSKLHIFMMLLIPSHTLISLLLKN